MKHWTEDDFQEWLYGLKEEDRHVAECAECRSEIARLRLERRQMLDPLVQPEVSQEFLAEQRRGIYRRLYETGHNRAAWRWALSAAMLLMMAIGFTVQQRGNRPASGISDEQLFSDLSAIEQSAEPKAIAPMHKLFEE
jgi:predicted anti-sigma-YlaC factor YlaD